MLIAAASTKVKSVSQRRKFEMATVALKVFLILIFISAGGLLIYMSYAASKRRSNTAVPGKKPEVWRSVYQPIVVDFVDDDSMRDYIQRNCNIDKNGYEVGTSLTIRNMKIHAPVNLKCDGEFVNLKGSRRKEVLLEPKMQVTLFKESKAIWKLIG